MVVRVWVPLGASICVAVSSLVMPSETSAMLAATPGAASRMVTSHSACAGERPRLAAASSSSTGAWAMLARRLINASGRKIIT